MYMRMRDTPEGANGRTSHILALSRASFTSLKAKSCVCVLDTSLKRSHECLYQEMKYKVEMRFFFQSSEGIVVKSIQKTYGA